MLVVRSMIRSGSRSHQGCSAHRQPAIASAPSTSSRDRPMSEKKLYAELHLSRIASARDSPDGRRDRDVRRGIQKVRVVGHVEELAAKLCPDALEDREILEKAHIEYDVPRPKQTVAGCIAVSERRGKSVSRRIKPAGGTAVGPRQCTN